MHNKHGSAIPGNMKMGVKLEAWHRGLKANGAGLLVLLLVALGPLVTKVQNIYFAGVPGDPMECWRKYQPF